MTKETSAKVAFYLSLAEVAETILYLGWFIYMANDGFTALANGDSSMPSQWLAYGTISNLLLITVIVTGVIGLRSAKRVLAKRSLMITGVAAILRYVIPFAMLISVMANNNWD